MRKMVYYMMNNENDVEDMKEVEYAFITKRLSEMGKTLSEICRLPPYYQSQFDKDVKDAMVPFFAERRMVPGKTKAVVCKEACKMCEELGMTEGRIINVVFSKEFHEYDIPQYWYVYKENGVWYQKMGEDCEAKHEVKL